MSYQVLINLATLRQHPNWVPGCGVRMDVRSGPRTEYLTLVFRDGPGWRRIELIGSNVNEMRLAAEESRVPVVPRTNDLAPEGWVNAYRVDEPTQPFFDMGGRWLYDYHRTMVNCDCCGAEFNHDAVGSEWDDERGSGSDRVCPGCGNWDCCVINRETLTEAYVRLQDPATVVTRSDWAMTPEGQAQFEELARFVAAMGSRELPPALAGLYNNGAQTRRWSSTNPPTAMPPQRGS